jgi:hypothetical protein
MANSTIRNLADKVMDARYKKSGGWAKNPTNMETRDYIANKLKKGTFDYTQEGWYVPLNKRKK